MDTTLERSGDQLILRIGGALTALCADGLRATIDEIVAESHDDVVVDLGQLRVIDSSGVGALVSLYKRLRQRGGSMIVRAVSNQPLAIFRLLRLDRVLFPKGDLASGAVAA